MISITQASEDAHRRSKGPVVTVSHLVTRADVVQILRAHAAEFGVRAASSVVQEALGDLSPAIHNECAGEYYCYVPSSGRGPKVPHSTLNVAVAEAKRLAVVSQKPTCVLKLIANVAAPQTPEVIWASPTK